MGKLKNFDKVAHGAHGTADTLKCLARLTKASLCAIKNCNPPIVAMVLWASWIVAAAMTGLLFLSSDSIISGTLFTYCAWRRVSLRDAVSPIGTNAVSSLANFLAHLGRFSKAKRVLRVRFACNTNHSDFSFYFGRERCCQKRVGGACGRSGGCVSISRTRLNSAGRAFARHRKFDVAASCC